MAEQLFKQQTALPIYIGSGILRKEYKLSVSILGEALVFIELRRAELDVVEEPVVFLVPPDIGLENATLIAWTVVCQYQPVLAALAGCPAEISLKRDLARELFLKLR